MTRAAPAAAKGETPAKGTLEVAAKVNVAPADPVVDQYRRRLSMALF
jgi:putative thioredoxin